MAKIKDVERAGDIEHVVKRLLSPDGGGFDIICDEFSSFTPNRPVGTIPPSDVVKAVAGWIGNMDVAEEEE